MTPFIQRPDDPEIPPPYTFPNVTIHSFELAADMTKLRQLCDSLLNIGDLDQRGFLYRPLLPYVSLEVLEYPKMMSAAPPFSQWGYITQHEAYIRFPVVKYEVLGWFLLPVEVSNFFPFLFVDSNWSAFSGREVIGFPKVIGSIGEDTTAAGGYSASVSVPVFPVYSPDTQQTSRQIVNIETGPLLGPGNAPSTWPWLITAYDDFAGDIEPLVIEVAELIYPDLFSTIALKQIRDAENSEMACFQALVHSEFQVDNVSEPHFFESATVTLNSWASLDLAASFGLPADASINPVLAYRTRCDMTFGNTTNLFINS
jgi:Acetoacetate decarboxylase (ADC)